MKKSHFVVFASLALGAMTLGAGSAAAQAVVASPFHAGQWGIEAQATGSGGGVLRFLTDRTALILGVTELHTSYHQEASPPFQASDTKGNQVDVSLGLRRHNTIAPGIAVTLGAGAMYSKSTQHYEYQGSPGSTNDRRTSGYGGFAEAGGQFMPTAHVAIGIAYRLEALHSKTKEDHLTVNGFATAFLPFRVSLYF